MPGRLWSSVSQRVRHDRKDSMHSCLYLSISSARTLVLEHFCLVYICVLTPGKVPDMQRALRKCLLMAAIIHTYQAVERAGCFEVIK